MKTGKAIIVHEASLSFGVGAEIAARISEKALYELDAPIERVASFSLPYPFPAYEAYYMPTVKKVEAAIDRVLSA